MPLDAVPGEGKESTGKSDKSRYISRRSFLGCVTLTASSFLGYDALNNAMQPELKPIPQDTEDFVKLITAKFGESVSFFEGYAAARRKAALINSEAPESGSCSASHLPVKEKITQSITRSAAFLSVLPDYISNYQQSTEGVPDEKIDCNDHSREAGDFCHNLGLTSYHISVCPKNIGDAFRIDSHQFHCVRISENLFIFFDHVRSGNLDVIFWHGSLNEYIDNYRICGVPMKLFPLVAVTKHTPCYPDITLVRFGKHITQNVSPEDMQTADLMHDKECSGFIKNLKSLFSSD